MKRNGKGIGVKALMYQKLQAFINQFVTVGTTIGGQNSFWRARLLEVTPTHFEMELFSNDGEFEGYFCGPIEAITSLRHGTRKLKELSLKVAYNTTQKLMDLQLETV